ncbi:MAG: VTC domain-containing protein [Thermodesulfobacteriota bacterium]
MNNSADSAFETSITDEEIGEPEDIFEVKYVSPRHARNRVLSFLRHRTSIPKSFAEAKVKTIYFDDKHSTSYLDSLDGFLSKQKYRLREYIDSVGGARYSLEVKLRNDMRTSKVRKLVFKPLPETYKFSTFRDLLDTFERENGFSLSRIRHSLPRGDLYVDTTIYYERFRFDDPFEDVRYNLDTNIMLVPSLRSERALKDGVYLDHDIFEIKGALLTGLPSYLEGLGIEPASFSKFVWGKELFI